MSNPYAIHSLSGELSRLKLLCVVLLSGLLFKGCLLPQRGGANDKTDREPGRRVKAEKQLIPMHTRGDIGWPTAACRARAAELLAEMTLEEKIGQMVQPDRNQLRNDHDIARYAIGSVLSGGNTDPPTNTALAWAKMVGRLHAVSLQNRLKIPILYATDAVHGHNNVVNAVVFPHNIGLGCTRNPELVRRIGRVTALEVKATLVDWTFAPVVAASRDERWGRAYEAFGETPELSAELGKALILGLQGDKLGSEAHSVLACAKHFAGDGGTRSGTDQGNTVTSEAAFKRLHVQQYKAAIEAGVGSIMVSFSSFNSVKMHCHGRMLNDVLKGEMQFNGFLVSDWQAVEKTPGDYETQVKNAINAGLDMVMAPNSYRRFISTLEDLVPDQVSMQRIDDAVGRILSVKCELGMFRPDHYRRDRSGQMQIPQDLLSQVGSQAHRAVARDAVRQSLVRRL